MNFPPSLLYFFLARVEHEIENVKRVLCCDLPFIGARRFLTHSDERNRRSLCRQKDAILPLQSGSSIDSEKYPQIGMHCISRFIPFCSSVDYLRANIMRAALRNPQTPAGGSQTVFLCWRSVKILAYLCILETRLPYSFICTYGSKTGNKYP